MSWVDYSLGLGLEPKDLTFLHVALRSLVVFIVALVLVRLADRRFLGKLSAVDAILGFVLASMLARAINGSAPFFQTLGGGFVLIMLHKLCAAIAFRSEKFSELIKGCEEPVIKDGVVQQEVMRKNHITNRDLLEELRQEGKVSSPDEVKTAVLERSGKIWRRTVGRRVIRRRFIRRAIVIGDDRFQYFARNAFA